MQAAQCKLETSEGRLRAKSKGSNVLSQNFDAIFFDPYCLRITERAKFNFSGKFGHNVFRYVIKREVFVMGEWIEINKA